MDWFWHALLVCAVVIPVALMWIAIIVEVLFRRHDLSGLARVTWVVLLFVFPLVGSFLYVIVTWSRAGHENKGIKQPARDVDPAHASTVSDLTQLDKDRRSGAITEAEFEEGSDRVLKGAGGPDSPKGAHS